jgi:hypothetical protein
MNSNSNYLIKKTMVSLKIIKVTKLTMKKKKKKELGLSKTSPKTSLLMTTYLTKRMMTN